MSMHSRRAQVLVVEETDSNTRLTTLQLLVTNDTHSQTLPFAWNEVDRRAGAPTTPVGGVARRSTCFKDLRALHPTTTLTLDAGDLFTGSPFFQYFQGAADFELYERLEYDAMALGNHDVDGNGAARPLALVDGGSAPDVCGDELTGLPHMLAVAKAHAPRVVLLNANVRDAATGLRVLPSHTTFVRDGVKIGVCALLGPQAWSVIAVAKRRDLFFDDFLATAHEMARVLREEEHCDVLVALSHTGVTRGDVELAALKIFDVVFSGHEHFYGVDGLWVDVKEAESAAPPSMPALGDRLGLLSRGFARGGAVVWARFDVEVKVARVDGGAKARVVDARVGTELIDSKFAPDTVVEARIATWAAQFESIEAEVVGTVSVELSRCERGEEHLGSDCHESVLALAAKELLAREGEGEGDGDGEAPTVVQPWFTLTNSYQPSSACEAGPITRRKLNVLLPFDAPMVHAEMRGTMLRAVIHRNTAWSFRADFLIPSQNVRYTFGRVDGSSSDGIATREEVEAGAYTVEGEITIDGEALDDAAWYGVLTTEFVLDTLLESLPERDGGLREVPGAVRGLGTRLLIEAALRKGWEL